MRIQITDDYVMTSDTYNFILNRKVTVQKGKHDGEEALDPIGFYSLDFHIAALQICNGLVRGNFQTGYPSL